MKSKNGFTLVELLVTITIMISIMAIAIVSFTTISKQKKEDSYRKVQNEAETAGEQYFENNSYLFEDMSDGSVAKITIGTLVDKDYLNKITDPRTGKTVNKCDYIEVTKKNNKYTGVYKESDDENCNDSILQIIIKEPGAPSISITNSGNKGTNDWYTTNVKTTATINTNDNGNISEILSCMSKNGSCNPNTPEDTTKSSIEINNNTNDNDGNIYIAFSATNISNKKTFAYTSYKKDTVKPTINVSLQKNNKSGATYANNTWYNNNVYTSSTSQDNLTQNPTITFTTTGKTTNNQNFEQSYRTIEAEGTSYITYNSCDEAGNCISSDKYIIKIDKTNPTCVVSNTGTVKLNKVGSRQWYKTDVTIIGTCSDTISGCKVNQVSVYKNREGTYYLSPGTVSDNAGNSTVCSKNDVGIENKVTITFNADKTNSSSSYNPGKTSNGKAVFNSDYSDTCKFGTCTNIKCTTDGSTVCDKDYYAKSCMYVKSYDRVFNATGVSIGNNVEVKSDGESNSVGMGRYKTIARYNCTLNKTYNTLDCGNDTGGLLNASAHIYQYTSPAGNKSNQIQLFVDYGVDCGY